MIFKDIKADFGATGDGGVHPDAQAFADFRSWAIAQGDTPITLTMPAGDYQFTSDNSDYDFGPVPGDPDNTFFNQPFWDIKDLTVSGYGASLAKLFGGAGIRAQVADNQYFIKTVSAGAQSIRLINKSAVSNFSAGEMVMLGGLDLQGSGGPPNLAYQEYIRIISVDSNTGIIEFGSSLQHGYRQEWPLNFISFGGPAAIYKLYFQWDVSLVIKGLRIKQVGQNYIPVRDLTLVDMTWDDVGFIPTATKSLSLSNSSTTVNNNGFMEYDKLVESATISNYTTRKIEFQSCSDENVTFSNVTASISIQGLPTNITADGVTTPLWTFGTSYGQNQSFILSNSTISEIGWNYGNSLLIGNDISGWGFAGGTFTQPGTSQAIPWAVPGGKAFLIAPARTNLYHPFLITGIRQVNGITYVDTNLPDPLPTLSDGGGTPTHIFIHPAPNLTVRNCTGCDNIVDLSGAPANSPLGTYSFRTFTDAAAQIGSSAQQFFLAGRLVSLKVNVTRPYTGSTSASLCIFPNGVFGSADYNADGSYNQWAPKVDLKIAGLRTFTPTSNSGIQDTDIVGAVPTYIGGVSIAGDVLLSNGQLADTSGDTSGQKPIVTVEWIVSVDNWQDTTKVAVNTDTYSPHPVNAQMAGNQPIKEGWRRVTEWMRPFGRGSERPSAFKSGTKQIVAGRTLTRSGWH